MKNNNKNIMTNNNNMKSSSPKAVKGVKADIKATKNETKSRLKTKQTKPKSKSKQVKSKSKSNTKHQLKHNITTTNTNEDVTTIITSAILSSSSSSSLLPSEAISRSKIVPSPSSTIASHEKKSTAISTPTKKRKPQQHLQQLQQIKVVVDDSNPVSAVSVVAPSPPPQIQQSQSQSQPPSKKQKQQSKRKQRNAGPNPSNSWLPNVPSRGTLSMDARERLYLLDAGIYKQNTNKIPKTGTAAVTSSKKGKGVVDWNDTNTVEMKFGRLLGSPDQKIRHSTIRKLEMYLKARCCHVDTTNNTNSSSNNNAYSKNNSNSNSNIELKSPGISELDLLKLWKGMYATIYLCDRAPVQEHISTMLSKLIWCLVGTKEEDAYVGQLYLDFDKDECLGGVGGDDSGVGGSDLINLDITCYLNGCHGDCSEFYYHQYKYHL